MHRAILIFYVSSVVKIEMISPFFTFPPSLASSLCPGVHPDLLRLPFCNLSNEAIGFVFVLAFDWISHRIFSHNRPVMWQDIFIAPGDMDNIPFKTLGLMYRGYDNMVIRHVCFIHLTFSFELASSSSQRAMSWFRVGFVFGWVWGCKAGRIYIILKLF